jgi:hypothetical protein
VTRKSTATLFVEASKYLLYNHNASAAGRHDSKKKEKECDSQWSEASADLGEGGGGGGGGDEDVGAWLRDMSDVRESSKRGTLPIGDAELLQASYIAAGAQYFLDFTRFTSTKKFAEIVSLPDARPHACQKNKK